MLNPMIDINSLNEDPGAYNNEYNNDDQGSEIFISDYMKEQKASSSRKFDLVKECEDRKKFEGLKKDYYKYLRRFLIYESFKPVVDQVEDSNEV